MFGRRLDEIDLKKKMEKRRADDLATIFVVVLPLKDNDFVIW